MSEQVSICELFEFFSNIWLYSFHSILLTVIEPMSIYYLFLTNDLYFLKLFFQFFLRFYILLSMKQHQNHFVTLWDDFFASLIDAGETNQPVTDTDLSPYFSETKIGFSRSGEKIPAWKLGDGTVHLSLIGGCHGDEPVGPALLRQLVQWFFQNPCSDWLKQFTWHIIPHMNPDAELINNNWWTNWLQKPSVSQYLLHRFREKPGEDIEFGFPSMRPENEFASNWWNSQDHPWHLHMSFHGMGFSAGPWFLIDTSFKERMDIIRDRCTTKVHNKGYQLHDVERNGEKGFERLGKGFCSRPDSQEMRKFFLNAGDEDTAQKFHLSSMEFIRTLDSRALTLVSEMPLFILPGVGKQLGPPDPQAEFFSQKIVEWESALSPFKSNNRQDNQFVTNSTRSSELQKIRDQIDEEAKELSIQPMPLKDQWLFQWTLLGAGIETIMREF